MGFPVPSSFPSAATIPAATYPAGAVYEKRWTIFEGDSLSTPNFATPLKWSEQLSTTGLWASLCRPLYAATSGGTSTDATARVGNYPPLNGYKGLYFLLVGTNDLIASVSAATILANITTLKNAAEALGYDVVLMEVPKSLSITGGKETERNTVNAGLLGLSPAAVVPCDTLLEDPSDLEYYLPDGVHLTTDGYGLIMDWINSNIDPLEF